MASRLNSPAFPIALFVISSLWTAAIFYPFFYSLLFPTQDIQHVVGALEGRETIRPELTSLVQETVTSVGHLKRAIHVGTYWHVSAEQSFKGSRTTKKTQYSYVAWCEKRSEPVLLLVTRTDFDGTRLEFEINEGEPMGLVRAYAFPLLVLALSLFWLFGNRIFRRSQSAGADATK